MGLLTLVSALLAVNTTAAQEIAPTISVKAVAPAKLGQPVAVTVSVTFAEGLHGYQNPPSDPYENPVKVSVTDKKFKLIKATYPKGVKFTQDEATKGSMVYMGKTDIPTLISIPKKAGTYKIPIQVSYQQCTASTCYPPSSASVTVVVTVKR